MPDTFAITVIFIVLVTLVAAFVRRIKTDKCLKDFSGDTVTLENTSGKIVWGSLRVENTGFELIYPENQRDEDGHEEASYILYKYEYPNIQALIRYHDKLTEKGRRQREKELKQTYHPRLLRRMKRKVQNVFKAVRDSFAEVINLLISRAKKTSGIGGALTSQDKYVSQMKAELMGTVGTSYEPLLERYVGHKVVLELIKGDKVFECCGVLKDYTAEFVEVMDVDYRIEKGQPPAKADLVVLRKYGVIRHLAEAALK